MGANGFDRMTESQVACPGCRLAWLIIRQLKFKRQLSVANGCLISGPSCRTFACGFGKGVKKRAARNRLFGPVSVRLSEIAELRACRLALNEAKKQLND